jgi:hypothetical protein
MIRDRRIEHQRQTHQRRSLVCFYRLIVVYTDKMMVISSLLLGLYKPEERGGTIFLTALPGAGDSNASTGREKIRRYLPLHSVVTSGTHLQVGVLQWFPITAYVL